MNRKAIGIDLGTTYTSVGVYRDGQVEIIPNERGCDTIPSWIYFGDTVRLIGDYAKEETENEPANHVFNVKKIIGRPFNDQHVFAEIHLWPFTVCSDNGNPKIRIVYQGEVKYFSPEEISAMMLHYIKTIAENYIGETVTDCVITVPPYFNNAQRKATSDAGTIAGLNVLQIINEPTAAALAYGFKNNYSDTHKVLIFDLGGSTCNVSILTVEGGYVYEVNSTIVDTNLGGDNFDKRLVQYFTDEVQNKFKKDITKDMRAMHRLKVAAEEAKKILSTATETVVELKLLFDNVHFRATITRDAFEIINFHLFRLTLELIQKALCCAQVFKKDIDDVILIGGSTKIPIVQNLIRTYFYGKTLNMTIDPNVTVAYGAAVQAAILNEEDIPIKDIIMVAVTPLSLGIEIAGGIMMKVIERNTRIPCKHTRFFSTYNDFQHAVSIKIFEGERALTKDNNPLGKFVLRPIAQATRGIPKIRLTFEIDINGILEVTATDEASGYTRMLIIDKDKLGLSHREIQNMLSDAEKYKLEDRRLHLKVAIRYDLEKFIFGIKHAINECAEKFNFDERRVIFTACEMCISWLHSHQNANNDEVRTKKKELLKRCAPIMAKRAKVCENCQGACSH